MNDISYHIGAAAELQRQRDDAINRLAHTAGEVHSLRIALSAAQQEMQSLRDQIAAKAEAAPADPTVAT